MTATKERLTVTIDVDVATQIKALAGDGSVSSIVEKALRAMLTRQQNARARLKKRIAEVERRNPEAAARARANARALVSELFGDEA